MAEKLVLPRVHVMVLCDEVAERDEETTTFDLFGVRSHLLVPEFPYTHPQLLVYLQMTGHEGTAAGRVVIVDTETDEELIVSAETTVPFTGPLAFMHVFFSFPNCTFPQAGVYFIQVFFDKKLVGERALHLIEQETGSNGQTH